MLIKGLTKAQIALVDRKSDEEHNCRTLRAMHRTEGEKERIEDAPRRLRRGQDNPISFLCKISVRVAC